jgi:hypothetical protein
MAMTIVFKMPTALVKKPMITKTKILETGFFVVFCCFYRKPKSENAFILSILKLAYIGIKTKILVSPFLFYQISFRPSLLSVSRSRLAAYGLCIFHCLPFIPAL